MAGDNRGNSPGYILIRLKELSEGTEEVLVPSTTIKDVDVGGVAVTPVDAKAKLDGWAVFYSDPPQIQASWKKSIVDRDGVTPTVLLFIKDYEEGVRVKLGRSNPQLKKFGMTPEGKRKQLTAAAKADAAETAQATRVLRGEKGKKQRKAIKAPRVNRRTKPSS